MRRRCAKMDATQSTGTVERPASVVVDSDGPVISATGACFCQVATTDPAAVHLNATVTTDGTDYSVTIVSHNL